VFLTSTGTARSRHNLRQDVVEPVVNRANRLVEERGLRPLPLGITPHKLRHTFASILVAIGKDPTYVMQQLGHTDPAFTLRVYSHMMRRSDEEREELKALVEGRVLAGNSRERTFPPLTAPPRTAADQQKSPALAGLFCNRGARI
jgi:integrase